MSQEHVPNLGLHVLVHATGQELGLIQRLIPDDATLRPICIDHRRHPHDPNGVLLRRLSPGSPDQQRRQEVRQQLGAQAVGGHAQLVALRALGVVGRQHHAGVVEEHVEPVFSGQEVLGRGADRAQVGQVDHDAVEAAGAGGELLLYALDGGFDLAFRSGGNVDGAVLLVEQLGQLEANT